jgi:hypothetical protein
MTNTDEPKKTNGAEDLDFQALVDAYDATVKALAKLTPHGSSRARVLHAVAITLGVESDLRTRLGGA